MVNLYGKPQVESVPLKHAKPFHYDELLSKLQAICRSITDLQRGRNHATHYPHFWGRRQSQLKWLLEKRFRIKGNMKNLCQIMG